VNYYTIAHGYSVFVVDAVVVGVVVVLVVVIVPVLGVIVHVVVMHARVRITHHQSQQPAR
jgi:Flp pilus assembly protein TadB